MRNRVVGVLLAVHAVAAGCSAGGDATVAPGGGDAGDPDGGAESAQGGAGHSSSDASIATDTPIVLDVGGEAGSPPVQHAQAKRQLWYVSDEWLVLIELGKDGTVDEIVSSAISGLNSGFNCVTMLNDGSLLGVRLTGAPPSATSQFYHVPEPPTDGSSVEAVDLGTMPDGIALEGLYTDCEGRVYAMDTGEDVGSNIGNRLIRFTGNLLDGDYSYEVVTDLSSASVADIDDMAPGIGADGAVTDNPGLAIDSGTVHAFDYLTGTGTQVGEGGDYGIHVLGGSLFDDGAARIYLLDQNAKLYLFDPNTGTVLDELGQGPTPRGYSGLTGSLTACVSEFPEIT